MPTIVRHKSISSRCRWIYIFFILATPRDLFLLVLSLSLLSAFLSYHSDTRPERTLVQPRDIIRYPNGSNFSLRPPNALVRVVRALKQLEADQLKILWQLRHPWSLLRILTDNNQDLLLYTKALQGQDWALLDTQKTTNFRHRNKKDSERLISSDWSLLLCFQPNARLCRTVQELKLYQKINVIPSLDNLLQQTRIQCGTSKMACYILPRDWELFLSDADSRNNDVRWYITTPLTDSFQIVTTATIFDLVRRKQFFPLDETVIMEYTSDPLQVLDHPINIELYLLITNTLPLRAYIHREGLVHLFKNSDSQRHTKVPSKTFLLSELWQRISSKEGSDDLNNVNERIGITMATLLSQIEQYVLEYDDANNRCQQQCFQLLSVQLSLNSSLHPQLVGLSLQPMLFNKYYAEDVRSFHISMLKDIVRLVSARNSVHSQVLAALTRLYYEEERSILYDNGKVLCDVSRDICLHPHEINYLLQSQRERSNSGGFLRIFASQVRESTNNENDRNFNWVERNLEKFYPPVSSRSLTTNYEEDHIDKEDYTDAISDSRNEPDTGDTRTEEQSDKLANGRRKLCLTEGGNVHITEIFSHPHIPLRPQWSPLWMEYETEVPYDVIMIRLNAFTSHCESTVKLHNQNGPIVPANVTVGLGITSITLLVVSSSSRDPEVFATYVINIYRPRLGEYELPFDPSTVKHVICGLRQECDLRVSPVDPCGLQQEPTTDDWPAFLRNIPQLPPCDNGDAEGRWVLPCHNCQNRSTCYWKQIIWQPFHCQYATVPREALGSCLAGKKLLFVGDSTNRGMAHYLLEQLNGTLTDGRKTHGLKVFPGLNHGRTFLAFAYYPQFWLQPAQRPVFEKTIYQLLLKCMPLENNTNTIIVVGGVHWMATQHVHMVLRSLRRRGLEGAEVVVKTLGSGFHVPADGVHYLTKPEQEKLRLRSQGLSLFGRHYHLQVVDTFNMTVARFKDFHQGKCACHFHKIVEVPRRLSFYHVEGDINAIYTEILISRLCSTNSIG